MAESILDTGTRGNNMERVYTSMPKERRNTASGNMGRESDGWIIDLNICR